MNATDSVPDEIAHHGRHAACGETAVIEARGEAGVGVGIAGPPAAISRIAQSGEIAVGCDGVEIAKSTSVI